MYLPERERERGGGRVDSLFVKVGNVCKELPSLSVDLVCESRVIRVQLCAIAQHLVGKTIQVLDMVREPRHLKCVCVCVCACVY